MTGSQIYQKQEQQLKEEQVVMSAQEIQQLAAEDERVPMDFKAAVLRGHPGVIGPITAAESDPTRAGHDAEKTARRYKKDGAVCLAVDGRFIFYDEQDAFMRRMRERVDLPILRCIYTIDAYQVYQTLLLGYDAILLSGGLLTDEAYFLIVNAAHQCGLQTVTLVHNVDEVKTAANSGTDMIAAGNATDDGMNLDMTAALLKRVPSQIVGLSFGGVITHAELNQVASYGAAGVLVDPAFFDGSSTNQT